MPAERSRWVRGAMQPVSSASGSAAWWMCTASQRRPADGSAEPAVELSPATRLTSQHQADRGALRDAVETEQLVDREQVEVEERPAAQPGASGREVRRLQNSTRLRVDEADGACAVS